MSTRLDKGITERPVRRLHRERPEAEAEPDTLVVEEPLEIRVAGEPMAVTMRTPGDDHRLAMGFLFAEGVIADLEDVGGVAHCGRPGDESWGNVVDVVPAPGTVLDPERLAHSRRGTLTTAACGVCGRRSIDDLLERVEKLEGAREVSREVLAQSTDRLRRGQANFERTGGIHAAAALSSEGDVVALAEDVGRHNAVDKVVGALLYERILGRGARPEPSRRPAVLVVSGRTSFEIVQKAAVAGIGAVAGVSAPTSLAVDLAHRAGITLAGFVRDGRMNLY